jgi:hypothetical protein
LLSHDLAKPDEINLDGIFEVLSQQKVLADLIAVNVLLYNYHRREFGGVEAALTAEGERNLETIL